MTEKSRSEFIEAGSRTSAEPVPTKQQTALPPWMAMDLGYRSADFDADDVYVFSSRLSDEGDLAVKFTGTAGEGGFVCAAAAIESGGEKIHIAQGGTSLSQSDGPVEDEAATQAFPPFLLSRSLFRSLKAGQTIAWPTVLTGDGKTVAVTRTGVGSRKIPVLGKRQAVPTIEARGEDVSLVILDNEAWPLILVDQEADECGWWLRAVGKSLDAGAIADSAANADDTDDEEDADDGAVAEGGVRRFEIDEKFWAISLAGASHTVKFGRIGTNGHEKTKTFDDAGAAKQDYNRLIQEKTSKGYEEVGADD